MRPDQFLNSSFFNTLSDRIEQLTPPGLTHLRDELHDLVKSILKEALGKMELVTREEFDIQSDVLAKTRSKLDLLESKVAQLEAQANQPPAE